MKKSESINAVFKEWALDHYKHFQCWPMEFEHDDIVYNYAWIWDQLEKCNFYITEGDL